MSASVKLTVDRDPNKLGHYRVIVEGFGIPQSAGRTAVIRIRGSDKWYDDNLFNMEVVEVDGGFYREASVEGKYLNEDWGEDEVHALVKIGESLEIKSNTVRGDFG